MVRKVFFSFYYDRDVQRAGIVRNSWVTKKDREDAGFWDKATWEEVQKKTKEEIGKWIIEQLNGTSVTVVLIGKETSNREWVRFEITESYKKQNGIFGIYIHNIKDFEENKDTKGNLNFGEIAKDDDGNSLYFDDLYPVYDWIDDDGYNNLGDWVDKAANAVSKLSEDTIRITPSSYTKNWSC
ncbi:MAG: TIR domain-containing protein [Candidatus Celaenobacter polaris]|nr:TIR domain-containing protein [Candidatus Celaenobacter polaris]